MRRIEPGMERQLARQPGGEHLVLMGGEAMAVEDERQVAVEKRTGEGVKHHPVRARRVGARPDRAVMAEGREEDGPTVEPRRGADEGDQYKLLPARRDHRSLLRGNAPERSSLRPLYCWLSPAQISRPSARSTDSRSPPRKKMARHKTPSSSGYSNPRVVQKKPCGRCTPQTMTTISMNSSRAPSRGSKPIGSKVAPKNSTPATQKAQAAAGSKPIFPKLSASPATPPPDSCG